MVSRGPLAPPLRSSSPPQPLPSPSLLPPRFLPPRACRRTPVQTAGPCPQGLALLWAGGQEAQVGGGPPGRPPRAATAPPTHLSGPVDGQADGAGAGRGQDAQRVPVVVGQPQRDAEGLEPIVRVQCLGGRRGGSVRAQGPRRGGARPGAEQLTAPGMEAKPTSLSRSRPAPLARSLLLGTQVCRPGPRHAPRPPVTRG